VDCTWTDQLHLRSSSLSFCAAHVPLTCILRVLHLVFYYESRKRGLEKRRKNEYRYDERLKTQDEEFTCLGYTGLHEELEHLKIKTRLISVKFPNVMDKEKEFIMNQESEN
jgi:hypothetical protein